MRSSIDELTREELLAITRRYIRFVSPGDIALARWEVAADRALALLSRLIETGKAASALLKEHETARTPQGKARAWSKYRRLRDEEDRLQARFRRADRRADQLYAAMKVPE